MSQSKRAWVGVMVLAIVLAAGVGVLLWSSQSGDTGSEADEAAADSKERGPTARPTLDEQGADGAGAGATPPAAGTLHDRLGGREAIFAVIGKLLDAVQKNQVLMANEHVRVAAQRVNVRELHQRVTNYVCQEAGGPCRYTGRPMKDYLVPLELGSAEWGALRQDLASILADMRVSEPAAQELLALFAALERDSSASD